MALSSFRPIRWFRISSRPAAVSKRHHGPSGTMGIAKGKSSRPTTRATLHRLLGGGLQIPLGLGPGAQHAGDEEVLLAPERLDAVVGVVGNLAFAQEVPLDAVTHLSLLSGAALTAAAAEYPPGHDGNPE